MDEERKSISKKVDKEIPKEAKILDGFEWGAKPEAKSALLFAIYGNQQAIRDKLAEIKTRRLELSENQLKRYNLAVEACRDLGVDLSGTTDISKESLPQPELFPIHQIWETAAVQTINLGTEKEPEMREVLHLTGSLKKYLTIPGQSDPRLNAVAERINFLTSILIEGKTATNDTPFSIAIPLGPSGAEELNNLFTNYPKLKKKLYSADGVRRSELQRQNRKLPSPEEINIATAAPFIWDKIVERAEVSSHGFGGNSRSSRNLPPLLARLAEMGQRFHSGVMVFPSLMGADNSLARDFPPLSAKGRPEAVYPFTPAMEANQLIFFLETTGLLRRFAIDKHLLTLTGHSMGGEGTLLAGAELAGTYGEILKLNLSIHDPCTPGSQVFTENLEGALVQIGARLRNYMPASVGAIAEPLNRYFNPIAQEAASIHGENFVASEYGPAILHQLLGIEANTIDDATIDRIRRAVKIYPTIIHLAKHSRMLDFKKQFATLREWGLTVLTQIIEEDESDHFTQVAPRVKETIMLEGILGELHPKQAIHLLGILRVASFKQPNGEISHTLFPRGVLPENHTWTYLRRDPTATPDSISTPEDAIGASDLRILLRPLVDSEKLEAFYNRLKNAIPPLLVGTTFV